MVMTIPIISIKEPMLSTIMKQSKMQKAVQYSPDSTSESVVGPWLETVYGGDVGSVTRIMRPNKMTPLPIANHGSSPFLSLNPVRSVYPIRL